MNLLPYFFGYKTDISSYKTISKIRHFLLQNNLKNLDLSYETDLEFQECFGRENPILWQPFIQLIYLFRVVLGKGKPFLYKWKNPVDLGEYLVDTLSGEAILLLLFSAHL